MNANGPVLRDIHLPTAAWWPLAPGWWLLAALILLVVLAGAWFAWWRARRRPLAAALREVDRLAAAFARDADMAVLVEGASRLLRRVARRIEPAVASTRGEVWRAFVHVSAGDADTRKALDALLDARYRARPALDAETLLAALRTWCRHALGMRRVSSRHAEISGQPTRAMPT